MSSAKENRPTIHTITDSLRDALADTPAEAENLRLRGKPLNAIEDRINDVGRAQSVAARNLGIHGSIRTEAAESVQARFPDSWPPRLIPVRPAAMNTA